MGQRDVKHEPEWVAFPGGELEGPRPSVRCRDCRLRAESGGTGQADARPGPVLCFRCYRATLERERALERAGRLDTASVDRFQGLLPFEPVSRPRLDALKLRRTLARAAVPARERQLGDRRRQAQLAARQALRSIADGLRARQAPAPVRERHLAAAARAAELQLPESWLPFVVSW